MICPHPPRHFHDGSTLPYCWRTSGQYCQGVLPLLHSCRWPTPVVVESVSSTSHAASGAKHRRRPRRPPRHLSGPVIRARGDVDVVGPVCCVVVGWGACVPVRVHEAHEQHKEHAGNECVRDTLGPRLQVELGFKGSSSVGRMEDEQTKGELESMHDRV